jgi:hypothetical protein
LTAFTLLATGAGIEAFLHREEKTNNETMEEKGKRKRKTGSGIHRLKLGMFYHVGGCSEDEEEETKFALHTYIKGREKQSNNIYFSTLPTYSTPGKFTACKDFECASSLCRENSC